MLGRYKGIKVDWCSHILKNDDDDFFYTTRPICVITVDMCSRILIIYMYIYIYMAAYIIIYATYRHQHAFHQVHELNSTIYGGARRSRIMMVVFISSPLLDGHADDADIYMLLLLMMMMIMTMMVMTIMMVMVMVA